MFNNIICHENRYLQLNPQQFLKHIFDANKTVKYKSNRLTIKALIFNYIHIVIVNISLGYFNLNSSKKNSIYTKNAKKDNF